MSQSLLAEGSVFAERYRVVRCIAQGGMGAVYEVVHIQTKKHRALKVMLPNMLGTKGMQERFEQEARVTSEIESEFIVEVMDAGVDAATQMPFLVMELLKGEDLHRRLMRVGRFGFEETVTLLKQVATALDKTHRASIVHRDLKPENLFLGERDDGAPRIKILDFGVAKMLSDSATNARATQSLGTPLYMAPEQFNAGSGVSPATDIYALGLIAYTLLVGLPYWQDEMDAGTNIFAFVGVAQQGMKESPVARARRRGVPLPAGFDAWCARAAAPNPGDRFRSALEAITALADVLGVALGTTGSLERSASGSLLPGAPAMTASGTPSSSWKHTVPLESGLSVRSGPQTGTVEAKISGAGTKKKRGLWVVAAVLGVVVVGAAGMGVSRSGGGGSAAPEAASARVEGPAALVSSEGPNVMPEGTASAPGVGSGAASVHLSVPVASAQASVPAPMRSAVPVAPGNTGAGKGVSNVGALKSKGWGESRHDD